MKLFKKIWMLALLLPAVALASGDGVHLDKAPGNITDKASLQRGAKFFFENCTACHGASFFRYNRLTDIGMSEADIKALLPEGKKLGSTIAAPMDDVSAKASFGVVPPDLSVTARSRGTDWLFTYLRSFYTDPTRATGVNNLVFPGVSMPNILQAYQGEMVLEGGEHGGHGAKLKLATPGAMSTAEFDATVGDLVNFLDFVGEPAKLVRHQIGYIVLGFLFFLLILSYALKREFWKDIH